MWHNIMIIVMIINVCMPLAVPINDVAVMVYPRFHNILMDYVSLCITIIISIQFWYSNYTAR